MSVEQRPTPLHPPVETFPELAAWLVRRIDSLSADYNDPETQASIGLDASKRSQARVSAYRDVLYEISPQILREIADQRQAAADDADENKWRDDPSLGAGGSVEAYRG